MKLFDIVEKSKNRDNKAFQILFELFYEDTYRTSYMITRDLALAEDATQDAFLKAFKKLDTLRESKKFGSWVKAIAARSALDILRKRKRLTMIEDITEYPQDDYMFNTPLSLPETEAEVKELRLQLKKAIYSLNTIHRQVIIMKYYLNLDTREMSEVLDLPIGTIKSRLHRALKKLEKSLKPTYADIEKEGGLL